MSDPLPTEKIEAQTREQVAAWLEKVAEGIRQRPGAQDYPLSVLLMAPTLDDAASKVHWMTLCGVSAPNRPDGWAHALYLSRDLLAMLARLDADFSLGMTLLPGLIAMHPLFQQYAEKPAESAGPGRTVTELVEDGAKGQGNG